MLARASMEDLLLWSKGQLERFEPVGQLVAVNAFFADLKNYFVCFEDSPFAFNNPEHIVIRYDENHYQQPRPIHQLYDLRAIRDQRRYHIYIGTELKALSPVISWPVISIWISCVPS